MKSVLCYGDSNTWGYDAATKGRYPRDQRWTGVLRQALGDGYVVIEEGLNGRTTIWDDPIEGYKNGKDYLIPCLETHRSTDLVVLMLGTNDLKKRFSLSAYDIAAGAGVLIDIIMRSNAGLDLNPPQALLMCPPLVAKLTDFAEMFEDAEEKSKRLSKHYRAVAEELGCHFLDTSEIIVSSDLDGIHFDPSELPKLGNAVAKAARNIIG
jgi:lysophospholipase L1-like esterase